MRLYLKYAFFTFVLLSCLSAYCQQTRLEDTDFYISVESENPECTNMFIKLDADKIKHLGKILEKEKGKVLKWAQTAKKENITQFIKPLSEKSIHPRNDGCFTEVFFTYNGQSYKDAPVITRDWIVINKVGMYTNTWCSGSHFRFMHWFKVDSKGECFLVLYSTLPEGSVDPKGFSINIKVNDIEDFILTLKQAERKVRANLKALINAGTNRDNLFK